MTIDNVEHKCANCLHWGCSFYTPFDHCMLHDGNYTSNDCCNDFKERRSWLPYNTELGAKLIEKEMWEKADKPVTSHKKIDKWIFISERLPEDGTWNLFTDGNNYSVERYKADALDHFYPEGRWFSFEDAIAWMPLPKLPKKATNEMNIKVINAGNCMMCGREIKIVTNKQKYKLPNVLFCHRCEKENLLNMSVQNVIKEDKHD